MISLLIAVILIVYLIKNGSRLGEELFGFGFVVAIVFIVCGILVPMAGFTEPVEQTIELMPLRLDQETDKDYYIEYKDGYYYYAFDNSEEYGLDGGAYEREGIPNSSVKIYESEECTVPILKTFNSKSKISWYSLAGMWSSKKYIFYIPMGTKYVQEQVK